MEGAGVGVAGGGESEHKGAEVIDVVDVDDDDALTTAVQPVPAPPVDLTWNPKSDDDHLQTYVWIHKPDNSFVLREKLPGQVPRHGDLLEEVNGRAAKEEPRREGRGGGRFARGPPEPFLLPRVVGATRR